VADKKLKVDLEIATKKANADLKATAKEAKALGTELEETESAGKQMARALSQVAADIETEFADARSAAERLGEALGPEFAADAERGESAVMELVAQLKSAGLTYDDVRADADQLAASIKQLDTAGSNLQGVKRGALDVEDGFKRVSTQADNTRSVVANFAGNAASELPGITGAMGPLNMAIGQFGEYATEGNIKLKSFVTAGVGLGVVSLALAAIGDHFKKIAAEKAFNKARVEDFTEALVEADGALSGLAETLEQQRKVEVWNKNTQSTLDMTAGFVNAGLSLDDVIGLLEGGKPAIDQWAGASLRAGTDANLVAASVAALNLLLGDYEESATRAAAETLFFGRNAEDVAGVSLTYAERVDAVAEAQSQLEDEIAEANAALLEQAGILQEQIDAQRAAADSAFALRDAEDDLAEKVAGANDEMKEADGDLRKVRGVLDDVAQSAGDVADSTVRVWEEQAKANGTTLTAAQRQEMWNKKMIGSASTLDGPMRDAVLDYAANVNGIPPEKVSEIRALLDRGEVAYAEAVLNDASRTRDAAIQADALTDQAEQDLAYLARDRTSRIFAVGGGVRVMDSGGNIPSGQSALVAEKRPEFVNGVLVNGPADVTGGAETGRILGRMGGVGRSSGAVTNTYSITVNVAPGGDPASTGRALVEAIQDYERVNSSRWRAS
jgi:hypothetical protein